MSSNVAIGSSAALNAEVQASSSVCELLPQTITFSDCASDDDEGFEGFASPTATCEMPECSGLETSNECNKQLLKNSPSNVKVTKLEDTSESEENTKSSNSDGSSDSSSNDTDTDTDHHKKGDSDISQFSDDKLSTPKDEVKIVGNFSKFLQSSDNSSDIAIAGSVHNNIDSLSNISQSSNSSPELLEPADDHTRRSVQVTRGASFPPSSSPSARSLSSQSIQQITKAAIGEVVDASDIQAVNKLAYNVIQKMNYKEDVILVSGLSKLNSANVSTLSTNTGQQALSGAVTHAKNTKSLTKHSELENKSTKQNIMVMNSFVNNGLSLSDDLSLSSGDDDKDELMEEAISQRKISTEPHRKSNPLEQERAVSCEEDDYPPIPIQAEVVMSEGSDAEGGGIRTTTTCSADTTTAQQPLVNGVSEQQQVTEAAMQDSQLTKFLQSYVSLFTSF